MSFLHAQVLLVALTFVLGGCVKGITGMGLPTVAIGLLGLIMAPAKAAAFLVVPSLITNVWQFVVGPYRLALTRRMWPMLLMLAVATWAGTGLITGVASGAAAAALGAALAGYAMLGLCRVQLQVHRRHEPWLSPLVGVATGVVTGATGVLVVPAVPYLQALGLEKDELVQALGLSFTVSTIALAGGLVSYGAFHPGAAAASALCTLPALVGMYLGQAIRAKVDARRFRMVFFIGLLVLGADLLARATL